MISTSAATTSADDDPALATPTATTTTAIPVATTTAVVATTTTTTTTTMPVTTTTNSTTTSTTTSTSTTTTTTVPKRVAIAWPTDDSAAVAIPRLCVSATSARQPRVPIASLTKMMTVWVVLHQLPLTFQEPGPCLVVNAYDVALYEHDVATGQSNARIAMGEKICEGTLLRGLLVHSAGDYSQLLQRMIGWSPATFVRVMNIDARKMGLSRTHYVDLTGILPEDQSTAGDQATLAVTLMTNEPIVDQIVALTHVSLPYNGVVVSYTPYIGVANVVGVKSGFTNPAGGCDVMAVKVTIGANSFLTYAVVLGQHGGNALNVAGSAALTVSRSLRSSIKQVRTPSGFQLEWIGPAADVKG